MKKPFERRPKGDIVDEKQSGELSREISNPIIIEDELFSFSFVRNGAFAFF